MNKTKGKSTRILSQWQLRKMLTILTDRWPETWEIVATRNLASENMQQRDDLWVEQINL